MPQLQEPKKLSKFQQQLIIDNYDLIKEKISNKIDKIFKKYRFLSGKKQSILEVISYVPDVTLKWQPDKGRNIGYVNYVSRFCLLRYIDEYRRMYPNELKHSKVQNLVAKIKDELKKDVLTEDDIIDGLKKYVKSPSKYMKSVRYHNFSTTLGINLEHKDNKTKDFEEVKLDIKNSAEEILKNDEQKQIYLDIIYENLIPKAENQPFKSLEALSHKHGLSCAKIWQMSKDFKMRKIFSKYAN